LGADYKPLEPSTHFKFPDDDGSFAKATLRCIGLGACRKTDSGAMCPSYMATLEETHSTRDAPTCFLRCSRARCCVAAGKTSALKDALELCLSCKACKSECPANVDIATYKAEFLSHYYEKKRRPLNAYVFGLVELWARIGSLIPGIANFFSQTPDPVTCCNAS